MLISHTPSDPPPEQIAAIDLGSNSFHMIVARVTGNDFQVVDRLREMVRLGAGLDARKQLTAEAETRALECLERFGQRVRSMPPGTVRAVGTNTLRQVRDASAFLRRAEQALGHPIEIIAGREEARLVYLGVAHGLAGDGEQRLVIDIGGGSTELILGDGFQPRRMESLYMGCVSISRNYFADGTISAEAMHRAELACALEVRPVKLAYRSSGWGVAVGSSGTVRSIHKVVQAAGWAEPREGISRTALQRLRDNLVKSGRVDRLQLEGLSEERRPVFAGGVAVLWALFKALGIDNLQVSELALREGLLYEMLGRSHHEDTRERTVRSLAKRYEVDKGQAKRVTATAGQLFQQLADSWELRDGEYPELLFWAARLHEVGLVVAHAQYHKHGAYLVANSDLAGFSRQEQMLLAALIRGHRRKFPLETFHALPDDLVQHAMQLCVILRLAVLLHRARAPALQVDTEVEANGNQLALRFPAGWLDTHPLPRMELEQEAKRLRTAGFRLKYS